MSLRLTVDLRTLRKRAKLGAGEFAKTIGVHRNLITRMEAGQTPKLETALKVAKFFGFRVEQIWAERADEDAGRAGREERTGVHGHRQERAKQPYPGATQTSIRDC